MMNQDQEHYEDDAAAALYADATKRRVTGRAVSRRVSGERARLSAHVPVRFPEKTIRRVRDLANEDGVTVSAWIRSVVDREIDRRTPVAVETGHLWTAPAHWADLPEEANEPTHTGGALRASAG